MILCLDVGNHQIFGGVLRVFGAETEQSEQQDIKSAEETPAPILPKATAPVAARDEIEKDEVAATAPEVSQQPPETKQTDKSEVNSSRVSEVASSCRVVEQSTPNDPAPLSSSENDPIEGQQTRKAKIIHAPGSEQSPSPPAEIISPVARSAGEGSYPVAQIEPALADKAGTPVAPAPKDEPGIFDQIFGFLTSSVFSRM